MIRRKFRTLVDGTAENPQGKYVLPSGSEGKYFGVTVRGERHILVSFEVEGHPLVAAYLPEQLEEVQG